MVFQSALRLLHRLRILLLIEEAIQLTELVGHVVSEHKKLLQATSNLYPLLVIVGKGTLKSRDSIKYG